MSPTEIHKSYLYNVNIKLVPGFFFFRRKSLGGLSIKAAIIVKNRIYTSLAMNGNSTDLKKKTDHQFQLKTYGQEGEEAEPIKMTDSTEKTENILFPKLFL